MVPIVVIFFVAGAVLPAPAFLTTVPVLASLVSLVPLARRPARVPGLDGGPLDAAAGAATGRLPFIPVVVVVELELASDAVVAFLVPP